jgi:hypothetical protein
MPDARAEEGIQVMEHREPPRIALGDRRLEGAIDDQGTRLRLRPLDPFHDRRRRDLARPIILTVAGSAVLAAVVTLGYQPRFAGCIINLNTKFRSASYTSSPNRLPGIEAGQSSSSSRSGAPQASRSGFLSWRRRPSILRLHSRNTPGSRTS